MNWLNDNLWQVLLFAGLGILVLEVVVFGLSTFVLFFIGLATLLTGLLMWLGVLSPTLGAAAGSIAVFTALSAILLWKPMKRFQNKTDNRKASNDLIGYRFTLSTDASLEMPGSHQYSGIQWRVGSAVPLTSGTQVRVVATDVGELTVEAV